MRVLVTGAGGFIGGVLVRRLLREGHEVVALVHESAGPVEHPALRVVRSDILDLGRLAELIAGVTAVCHLAGAKGVRQSTADPCHYFEINVGGTVTLLKALRGRPCRVVFASSASVYGAPAAQTISEDQLPAPASPYGASKLAAEQLLRFESAAGRIGAISLRAFNVSGAHHVDSSRLIPRAVGAASGRLGALEINGDGRVVRDYVHVDDVATAFVLALAACRPGGYRVYNVGAAAASVQQVVEMVGSVSGKPVPLRHGPPAAEPEVLIADTRRIRQELGWAPERSTLAEIVGDAWAAG